MGIKSTVDVAAGTITFTPATGEPAVFHIARMHAANVQYATFHGMKQRIVDNSALSRESASGKSPTDEERMAGIRQMIQHYESGAEGWGLRATGEPRETGGGVLRAVAAIQGVSVEEMRQRIGVRAEKLGVTPRKLLNQLATSPAVQAKMVEFAPKATIDVEGLLEELGADDQSDDQSDE